MFSRNLNCNAKLQEASKYSDAIIMDEETIRVLGSYIGLARPKEILRSS